jgi:DNA processing protein
LTRAPLNPQAKLDWLRLARTPAVGPVTFAHLIQRHGTAARVLEALPELARRGGRTEAVAIPSEAEARTELEAGAALGARAIAACEPDYPSLLAAIDPPPPLIWVLGDDALLARRAVAIVGARVASAAGRRLARDLAAALGAAGWVVVSGLARGIDTAAHQGALASGTVAVLGGGVDDIYPAENADLYDAVRRGGGSIVSERAVGAQARAADFPRRNRIISGLSRGVVVVEAELRSGSLITARLAGEQGREVFAVPGSPLDPRSRGANELLRQGATLVETVDDVLRVLDALPGLAEPENAPYRRPGSAKTAFRDDSAGEDDGADSETTDLRERIETLLSATPTGIDLLVRESGAPSSAVLASLTELALADRIDLLPGNLAVRR